MRLLNKKLTDHSLSIFDPSLTPQNAEEKGYEYVDDVIYDQINPSEAMKDIFEFIQLFHCKLGTPVDDTLHCSYFGFYIPIMKNPSQRKDKKL